ncbi:hypothetical protein F2P79_002947 [Pimephales promelas]|nr:hypothetical protein F2P79_002947 [Pimephales promelas]
MASMRADAGFTSSGVFEHKAYRKKRCVCGIMSLDPEMRNSCNENSVEDAAGYTYKMRLHTSFSSLCHTNTFPTG